MYIQHSVCAKSYRFVYSHSHTHTLVVIINIVMSIIGRCARDGVCVCWWMFAIGVTSQVTAWLAARIDTTTLSVFAVVTVACVCFDICVCIENNHTHTHTHRKNERGTPFYAIN